MKAWDDFGRHGPGLCYTGRIGPEKIGYLVSLVEAYEGLAVVRTKDAAAGIVEFWISPSMREDFESFLEDARTTLGLVAGEPRPLDIHAPGFPEGGE